eukprot:4243690-Amphidinium_carterae.1
MADRLNLTPTADGWRPGDQNFAWSDSEYMVKWGSALQLCKGGAKARPDFQGLDAGLATKALRRLKLDGQSEKNNVKTALNAALGGVWHEARVHAEFGVGDLCVRCGAERREVGISAPALEAPPPCVKLHGLLPAPMRQVCTLFGRMGLAITVAILTFEGVVLDTTRTPVTVPGCPFRGFSNPSIGQSFWLLSGRLKNASRLGWSVIAKVWLPACMRCVLGDGILREGTGTLKDGLSCVSGWGPNCVDESPAVG